MINSSVSEEEGNRCEENSHTIRNVEPAIASIEVEEERSEGGEWHLNVELVQGIEVGVVSVHI